MNIWVAPLCLANLNGKSLPSWGRCQTPPKWQSYLSHLHVRSLQRGFGHPSPEAPQNITKNASIGQQKMQKHHLWWYVDKAVQIQQSNMMTMNDCEYWMVINMSKKHAWWCVRVFCVRAWFLPSCGRLQKPIGSTYVHHVYDFFVTSKSKTCLSQSLKLQYINMPSWPGKQQYMARRYQFEGCQRVLNDLFWHLRRLNTQLLQDLDGVSIVLHCAKKQYVTGLKIVIDRICCKHVLFEESQQDVSSINGVRVQPLGFLHLSRQDGFMNKRDRTRDSGALETNDQATPSPNTRFAAGVKGISTETMPVPRPTISSIVLRVSC